MTEPNVSDRYERVEGGCEARPKWRVWARGQSPAEPPSPFDFACDQHLPALARVMLTRYSGDSLDLDEYVPATARCAHSAEVQV